MRSPTSVILLDALGKGARHILLWRQTLHSKSSSIPSKLIPWIDPVLIPWQRDWIFRCSMRMCQSSRDSAFVLLNSTLCPLSVIFRIDTRFVCQSGTYKVSFSVITFLWPFTFFMVFTVPFPNILADAPLLARLNFLNFPTCPVMQIDSRSQRYSRIVLSSFGHAYSFSPYILFHRTWNTSSSNPFSVFHFHLLYCAAFVYVCFQIFSQSSHSVLDFNLFLFARRILLRFWFEAFSAMEIRHMTTSRTENSRSFLASCSVAKQTINYFLLIFVKIFLYHYEYSRHNRTASVIFDSFPKLSRRYFIFRGYLN